MLSPAREEELRATALLLAARGKGILAVDESTGTAGLRLASIGVENSVEKRCALRELLFTTPSIAPALSGAILYEETLAQSTRDGVPFVSLLASQGVLVGIKLDAGTHALPGGLPGETFTAGLDTLAARAARSYAAGARFAKWRAVLRIDPASGAPSAAAVDEAAHSLVRFGLACQAAGLVPLLEPEVLSDGEHSQAQCAATSARVLRALYEKAALHGLLLEGSCLKPAMVTPGRAAAQQASPAQVAQATLEVLRAAVPAAVPAVLFLSGGQSEAESAANLCAIVRAGEAQAVPWSLSFSFGRALQASALAAWRGEEANAAAAQAAFRHACELCRAAACGEDAE